MKSHLIAVLVFALGSALVSCDSSSSSDSKDDPTPSGPAIVGTWTVDTTVTLAGLPTEVTATMRVTADSAVVDTLERFNSDGGDIEDLYWVTRRTWTAVGSDVIFTKTSCRRTDFYGDWATISCLTPAKDTVVGGLTPGVASFKIRARESNLGYLVFHKK